LVELERRLPAVLRGDDHLADTFEQLSLGQICYKRGLHAAATRFFAAAFAAEQALADNLGAGHRFSAACFAALAGCGSGRDEPAPDEVARADFRADALNWLKADLAAWTKELAANPKVAPKVQQTLRHWRADPDLAGLRDETALAKLSDPERQTWRTFWADVSRTLDQAGEHASVARPTNAPAVNAVPSAK
jgi:hypothetical protein